MNTSNRTGAAPASLLLALYLLAACAGWTLWVGDPCFLADVRDLRDPVYGLVECEASYSPLSLVSKSVALVVMAALATWLALRGLPALSMAKVVVTAVLAMTLVELARLGLRGHLQYLRGDDAGEFLANALRNWFLGAVLAAMGAAVTAWFIRRPRE